MKETEIRWILLVLVGPVALGMLFAAANEIGKSLLAAEWVALILGVVMSWLGAVLSEYHDWTGNFGGVAMITGAATMTGLMTSTVRPILFFAVACWLTAYTTRWFRRRRAQRNSEEAVAEMCRQVISGNAPTLGV